jgi:ribosomal protein L11 methyltransferase
MERRWIRIEVLCSSGLADDLAAEIAEGFDVGVEILDTGVCFYLAEERFLLDGKNRLEQTLRDFKEAWRVEALPSYSFASIPDEDWMELWKANFKPLRVGRRLVVAPTWEKVEASPEDRIIRIDPGQAFGTGHHETTRLCLEWLEEWAENRHEQSSKTLLDVGTGSGILAIAGALLGFDRVLAVDNDPEAVAVARENLILNGAMDRIVLQEGTVADMLSRFDVVLANIHALPLIEMAELLVKRLNDPGTLVLSGILLDQKEAVQVAYERRGLTLRSTRSAGEWCLLEFGRFRGDQE